MFSRWARWLVRNRYILAVVLLLVTVWWGWHAMQVEVAYRFAAVLPEDHPLQQVQETLYRLYGDADNVIFIGTQIDSPFRHPSFLLDWYWLGEQIRDIEGVEGVLSATHLLVLKKDERHRRFIVEPILNEPPATRELRDQVLRELRNNPLGKWVYNDSTGALLMGVLIRREVAESVEREQVLKRIEELVHSREVTYRQPFYISGIVAIRTVVARTVKREASLFLGVATLVVAVLLFLLFRAVWVTVIPLIVAGGSVVWSLGILHALGYRLNLLTGLIPTILVVVVVPNCVYLIMRFHQEWRKLGSPALAWLRALEKVGQASFFTYLTTAIGFGVFIVVGSGILYSFGVVASLSMLSAYVLTVVLVPVLMGVHRHPQNLAYIREGWIIRLLNALLLLTLRAPVRVFLVFGLAVVLLGLAATRLRVTGYLQEELPGSAWKQSLLFFEENFGGVLPVELLVRTPEGRLFTLATLHRLDSLVRSLEGIPGLSRGVSLADIVKYIVYAFHGRRPDAFRLPTPMERSFLASYLRGTERSRFLQRFVDSSRTYTRVLFRMKDVGLPRYMEIRPAIDSVLARFRSAEFEVWVAGRGILFEESNRYLLYNLGWSISLALVLIIGAVGWLFRSVRFIVFAAVVNLVPLVGIAGLMSLLSVPLKPSTILIFSVVLGITVDSTIHLLTRFSQEYRLTRASLARILFITFLETGQSVLFNAWVLALGFATFAFSSFDGTQAIGFLVPSAFLMAMLANLVLLPALLSRFVPAR